MAEREQELDREDEVYACIVQFYSAYHIAPSIDDIADATGIPSKSTVRNILLKLEAAGKIGRWEGKSRGIYLK